jgi:hypothetical protein
MATAKNTTVTLTKLVPTTVEVPSVQLNLTKHEAEFLFFIMGRIGGSPTKSPRSFAKKITEALDSAFVRLPSEYDRDSLESKMNVLWFREPSEGIQYPASLFETED